jgi:hypothetical protein
MRQHGKERSDQCIKALEAAGEVTKAEEAELETRASDRSRPEKPSRLVPMLDQHQVHLHLVVDYHW